MQKTNQSIIFCFVLCLFSVLLIQCSQPLPESKQQTKKEVAIDSTHDAWFTCNINKKPWEKSDSLYAKPYKSKSGLFLSIDCRYNSVNYKKISLTIPAGRDTNNVNKQLTGLVNDTLIAMVIYSFAEIDYSSETPTPVNHIAFEIKPTALVSITAVDTVRHTISGIFKAVAEADDKKKYVFKDGIFRNVPILR